MRYRKETYGEYVGNEITQQEYEYAKQLNRPIYAYFKSDDCLVHPRHVERDTRNNRLLEQFKESLRADHTVNYFHDEQQLAVQAAIDLARVISNFAECERHPSDGESALSILPQPDVRAGHEAKNGFAIRCADERLTNRIATACADRFHVEPINDLLNLEKFKAVIIAGSGYRKPLGLSADETQHLLEFVLKGGGLLCAGQAWSWAYRKYGNMPVHNPAKLCAILNYVTPQADGN